MLTEALSKTVDTHTCVDIYAEIRCLSSLLSSFFSFISFLHSFIYLGAGHGHTCRCMEKLEDTLQELVSFFDVGPGD